MKVWPDIVVEQRSHESQEINKPGPVGNVNVQMEFNAGLGATFEDFRHFERSFCVLEGLVRREVIGSPKNQSPSAT